MKQLTLLFSLVLLTMASFAQQASDSVHARDTTRPAPKQSSDMAPRPIPGQPGGPEDSSVMYVGTFSPAEMQQFVSFFMDGGVQGLNIEDLSEQGRQKWLRPILQHFHAVKIPPPPKPGAAQPPKDITPKK